MGMVLDMKGKQVNVHYVNTPVPCVVKENFGGYSTDEDVVPLAEVLQQQETVHQSLQRNGQTEMPISSSTTNSSANQLQLQLSIDEALAKELQELEFNKCYDSESSSSETETTRTESSTGNGEGSSTNTSAQVVRVDNINPDNMTYEELQTLTEAIGTASRGLSDELISFLPTQTYKIGLFSKKDPEDCVICCSTYKNRDKLIRLPCQHQYHKDCITRWLKINKACPVCNEEVFGS